MRTYFKNALFLILVICLLIGIILYPEVSLKSAYDGLMTWFSVVLPSLLPFFIIAELLIEIGFVNILGNTLMPIMGPLFKVSGESAFPFAMSIISGYPVGPKLTSSLREKNLISKTEGERTLSFSSTSGPLFMLGAVSIGMLGNGKVAPLIMYPHYLGAITVGIIFRFYRKKEIPTYPKGKSNMSIILNNLNKNYSIGTILSNSVLKSINTLLLVGGFIIFYSMLTELIFVSSVFNKLIYSIDNMVPLKINVELTKGFIAGLLEVTTGAKRIASININLIYKLILINFLIGWSGFSIHSQALSFISKTDMSSKLYIFSKLLHGIFSSFYTGLLYMFKYKEYIEPSFLPGPYYEYYFTGHWSIIFLNSLKIVVFATLYMLITSAIMLVIYKISEKS